MDHSWKIASAAGAAVTVVVSAAGNIVLSTNISYIEIILSAVLGAVTGLVLELLFFSVDYSRTENIQFEDDEYYYYVKAVPKVGVAVPEKKVKRITENQPQETTVIREDADLNNINTENDADDILLTRSLSKELVLEKQSKLLGGDYGMLVWIKSILDNYTNGMYFPNIHIKDVIEILIVAVIVYEIMLWIKNTKAWMLLRGIIMLGVFILLAWIFQMHTILYLAAQSINVLAIAAVVVFQPELRRALEKLGEKNLLSNINPFDKNRENERFSDQTAEGIVTACFEMGKVCTGALIVVEQAIQLTEYEMTGIELDCKVSPQVLINIFEHNTPLHDGAIIIRGDRITSATCYLPLSDNMRISKDLGTRHRAALGMSEVCDALVIAVSEETGLVSVAMGGQLDRGITREELRKRLSQIQYRNAESKRFFLRKGWRRK